MRRTKAELDQPFETGGVSSLPDPLLTAKQVAAILRVRPKRVYELGIPTVRISARQLRWRPSVVQQWIASREAR